MSIAIISDIHGNADALKLVLSEIENQGAERILCLGDIIGYGPEPLESLDLVREHCDWALMGNHDFAVLYEPTSFNTSAEQAAFWTRRQFELEEDQDKQRERWEFLGSLAIRKQELDAVWVHASPRRPINEYIFPDDIVASPHKMDMIFECIESRCFCGHTHVPGVFTDEPDFYGPDEMNGTYRFDEQEKCIINPGSVGQPRDRDPRASFAIIHDDRVEFHRVEYPVQTVVDKVTAIADLSDFLGQRLLDGR